LIQRMDCHFDNASLNLEPIRILVPWFHKFWWTWKIESVACKCQKRWRIAAAIVFFALHCISVFDDIHCVCFFVLFVLFCCNHFIR
jgi:hypothetical protein